MARDIQHLGSGLDELVEAWYEIAYHCGDELKPSSRCAVEATSFSGGAQESHRLTLDVAQNAVLYTSAAAQHLRSLSASLGPEFVLIAWSLVRATAEYCGRAIWLLDPSAQPLARIARNYMEWIAGTQYARLAAERIGKQNEVRDLKRFRARLLSDAQHLFPDAALFGSVETINKWTIGGEPYSGLASAVNDYARTHLRTNGLYDTLSSFAHPSIPRLQRQVRTTDLGDRLHHAFISEPELIDWHVAVACASLYKAAHHVVAYLDLDDDPLENWADRFPDLLSSSP